MRGRSQKDRGESVWSTSAKMRKIITQVLLADLNGTTTKASKMEVRRRAAKAKAKAAAPLGRCLPERRPPPIPTGALAKGTLLCGDGG